MTISKKLKSLLLAGALCIGSTAVAMDLGNWNKRDLAFAGGMAFCVGWLTKVIYSERQQRGLQRSLQDRIELLAKQGGDVNQTLENGYTLLHLVVSRRNSALVQRVLDLGATRSVNAQNDDGNTPLHLCAKVGRRDVAIEIGRMLMSNGADAELPNNLGESVYDYVRKQRHTAFADMIKEEWHKRATKKTVPALLGVESLVHREATAQNQFPRLRGLPELRMNILKFVAGIDPETENNKRQHGS